MVNAAAKARVEAAIERFDRRLFESAAAEGVAIKLTANDSSTFTLDDLLNAERRLLGLSPRKACASRVRLSA